jgi:hypothetical protein
MSGQTDASLRIEIEDMARIADKPAWMIARSLARLIERGLVQVEDGTPAEAASSLRALAESYARPATADGGRHAYWDSIHRVWTNRDFNSNGSHLLHADIGHADPESLEQAIGVLKRRNNSP